MKTFREIIESTDVPEEEPKGKRTVRRSIYGNHKGYIGKKFWKNFGDDNWAEKEAHEWANSGK